MPPRRDDKSNKFHKTSDAIEAEIIEAYVDATAEDDFHLSQLPDFLLRLRIPRCYFDDVCQCTAYFYTHLDVRPVNPGNTSDWITFQFLSEYTLTSSNDPHQLLDVVDIDKLIRKTTTLIKFRDNHAHIMASWDLFVQVASPGSDPEGFRLTLPHLQVIKKTMNLEQGQPLGDSFLISMLSCCSTQENGAPTSFYLDKQKSGSALTIRDFAEILGNLGEFDSKGA